MGRREMSKLLVVIFVASLAFATGIVWERAYPGFSFKCVRQTADEGFVVGGNRLVNGKYTAHAIRFDTEGDTLWSTMIGDSSFSEGETYCIEEHPDGGFVATGFLTHENPASMDLFLARLSSDGEMLWRRDRMDSVNSRGFSVCVMPDGGFLVMGTRDGEPGQDGRFILIWYDQEGDEVNFNEFGYTYYGCTGYITCVTDDRIYLTGTACVTWPSRPMQACFSREGELLWYKHYWAGYGLYGRDAYLRPDGTCWFVTTNFVLVTSTVQGSVIEAYLVDWQQYSGDVLNSGDATMDGGMILCGACDYMSYPGHRAPALAETWDGWVVKLSNSGEIQWQVQLEDLSANQHLDGIKQLSTGGYITCGSYGGGWLIRFEPEQSVQEPGEPFGMDLQAIPNPSGSSVGIHAFIPQESYTILEVFDVAGRLMDSWAGVLQSGDHTITFDGLTPGVYFARARTANEEISTKVTVLR